MIIKVKVSYIVIMSFRLVRNLSLSSEGFPTRFACGNDRYAIFAV